MKPCAKNQKPLSLLSIGALEHGHAEELWAHVETCPGCRRYLEEMSNVAGRLAASSAAAPKIEASPTFHRQLARRIEAEKRPGVGAVLWAFLRSGGLIWRWVMPAAGVALGVFLVMTVLGPQKGKRTNAPMTGSIASIKEPAKDVAPTFGNYLMLANHSLDALNQELTKEADAGSAGMPIYKALMVGQAITTD